MASGPMLVTPQAMRSLWPTTTPGTPANENPVTERSQGSQWSAFWYQIDGIWMPRWGSLAR